MNYGHFDDERREYVITDPRTPVKWINYVGTLAFGGFVDQTGGSLICKGDPALNRIVKYLPQRPAAEFNGETLYLRLHEEGGYRIFSPYFTPTLDAYDRYECRVGLGYTRIVSEFYGIRTDVTIFVPRNGEQLIRRIVVTNLRDAPVDIDAIPVVEYTHFDALKQFTNADWVPQTMQSDAHRRDDGRVLLTQYAFMKKDTAVNYLTSNRAVASFDSDRAIFLGNHGYGTWAQPGALQTPHLSDSEARRGDNIGALLHELGTLEPGASATLITQLGQAQNVAQAWTLADRFQDNDAVDAALAELAAFWSDYLAVMQVETPDAAMNRMLNVHNPRQVYTTLTWSRYLSLYQLGFGARGIGFRDSSQDVMGALGGAPDEALALLRNLLSVQRRDGSAMHQYNPLTMEATIGDAAEREDRPDFYGDDHLWIIQAVTAYIKETGNLAFLDEVIPFYEKDRHEEPLEAAGVLEHLERALRFTRQHVGAHGLPLLGFADWNDTVNLPTGAESLFNASLYGRGLLALIELADFQGDVAAVERYRTAYAEMAERVNAAAWDGGWYVRYFHADGTPVGSAQNAEGKIFSNGQSWPVIAGFAPPARAQAALDAVYAQLNTAYGIKLSAPGYDGFDPDKGGVTTYPPGAKENGGIFLHANPWVMIAETLIGRGDRAYAYYRQINPAARNDEIDEFECEPYVYPQNILGDEHPQFGLARNAG